MKKIFIIVQCLFTAGIGLSQWPNAGLLGGGGNSFGTAAGYNVPINIFTGGIQRAEFTTNATMTNTLIPGVGAGDGLRIMPKTLGCGGGSYPSIPTASVDIWTSCSNGTNIRWDGSGQISGTNNRFEQWANYNGFYFNTFGESGIYKFARGGLVTALVGTNNFWRIGEQNDASNFNGARRLEVLDNKHQFRLTYANPNAPSGPFTDFFTNPTGNLQIEPSGGRVGINAAFNPQATLDINGDLRVRNVAVGNPNSLLIGVNASGPNDVNVRRLDFTGNANDVLLGNGTWGVAPSNVTADMGVSRIGSGPVQLGDQYWLFAPTNTSLTMNRQVRLNGNSLIFSGSGSVGIGLSWPLFPTEVLDVNGNARFRNVPAQGGQSLVLGLQNGSANDIELSQLAFPNDPNQVLLGDGTWGLAPNALTADNGLTINPVSNVQWGQINTGTGILNGGQLIQDTEIPMNSNNLSFYGIGVTGWNRIFLGSQFTFGMSTKMSLHNDTERNGFLVIHDGNSQSELANNLNPAGIRVMTLGFSSPNPTFSNIVSGVHAFSSNPYSMNSTGVIGIAGASMRERIGIEGNAVQTCASGAPCSNFGGRFTAGNANLNFGIHASVVGSGATNWAGYFVGNIAHTAAITFVSDSTFKQNIVTEQNILSQVTSLRPVNYSMRQDEFPYLALSDNLQHGFVSQEVQEIFPELVQTIIHPAQYDSLGVEISPETEILGLNYNGFISLNTAAIIELNEKVIEQEAQINDLNARLATLENCLLGILPMLCQMNNTLVAPTPEALQQQMRSMIDVELRNELAIVLDQNVPNPFAETTVITFSIPAAVTRAQIHFYDASGNLIKSVEITERGDGQLNVFGQDLSSGLYTYTLVADGQLIATKKMVKQ